MKQFIKKVLVGLGIFSLMGIVGCASQKESNVEDYLRCNATSKGNMAEIESGFFTICDRIVYYADKTDMSNWVAVCNKPDCCHGQYNGNELDPSCHARLLSDYGLMQKDNKLYYYDTEYIGTNEQGYIKEFTQDGSGSKIIYELPFTQEMMLGHVRDLTSHQEKLVLLQTGITEKGYNYKKILRFNEEDATFDTLFYGLQPEIESDTGGDFITEESPYYKLFRLPVSANSFFAIQGDYLIGAADNYNDGGKGVELWRTDGDTLEQINLPEDITPAFSYVEDNIIIYYEQNKGFFQHNFETGERICLAESQLEDAAGKIMTKEYFVE